MIITACSYAQLCYSQKWVYIQENPFQLKKPKKQKKTTKQKTKQLHFNHCRRKKCQRLHASATKFSVNLKKGLRKLWDLWQEKNSLTPRLTQVKENMQLSASYMVHKWPKVCRMKLVWQKRCSKDVRWWFSFFKWIRTESQEHNFPT